MKIAYSVIIPTLNGSSRISKVLDGLCRQSISSSQFEVIIIDDGSKPGDFFLLESLACSYKGLNIKVLRSEINYGPATARNIGMDNASGEYYFFTDDDCELPAQWMETHIDMYAKYPQISAVCGWYKMPVKQTSSSIYHIFNEMRYSFFFPFLYKRAFLNQKEGEDNFNLCNTANFSLRGSPAKFFRFDERFILPGGEDSEFGNRLVQNGLIVMYIPYFVLHNKEMSFRKFINLAKNRGYGEFVRKITGDKHVSLFNTYSYFIRSIDMASPAQALGGSKLKLKILASIWFFYQSSMAKIIYYFFWKRRMIEKQANNLSNSLEDLLVR